MAVASGAYVAGLPPRRFPPTASSRPSSRRFAVSVDRPTELRGNAVSSRRFEKGLEAEKQRKVLEEDEEGGERVGLGDYFEQAKVLIESDGGDGAPRWFSPLDCGSRISNSPLLLYLPGIDGVGLGLVRQHRRLGKIFDIWCLHIPVQDRTPFEELVLLVEETVRSENERSTGKPIYLVGESIGGCLALAVAARNPDIDLLIILANPATCYAKSQMPSLLSLLEGVPSELSLINLPFILGLIAGEPSKILSSNEEKRDELGGTITQLAQGLGKLSSYLSVLDDIVPRETLMWKLRLMKSAASFANSRMHAVKAQILILASERDPLLPNLEEAERICEALPKQELRLLNDTHKIPKCEIRKFNDSGHFLFLEDDIDLVTIIKGVNFYRRAKVRSHVADYLPPTESEYKKAAEPFRWIEVATDPVMLSTMEDGTIVRGLAGIPLEGPLVLVGNHMFLGLDMFSMVMKFMDERNILLRGLAHPMIFFRVMQLQLDISSFDAFRVMGAVPVTASNFYDLLSSGSHVLLYPGGLREALHRKGEEYQLFWPERSEFVRMAARFGAKIVPFGVVGEDDVCELVLDYDDQIKIPFVKEFYDNANGQAPQVRRNSTGEIANQAAYYPGVLPKLPGRFYYLFGKPIDTAGMQQELRNKEKAHELYLHVKSEVEHCMSYLKDKREKDPYRSLVARGLYQAIHGSTSKAPSFEL